MVASPLLAVLLPPMDATNVMENGHPAAFQLLPNHMFFRDKHTLYKKLAFS